MPIGPNCALSLIDIFLYSHEQNALSRYCMPKETTSQLSFTYKYIDDVLSINNTDFDTSLGQMYPAEIRMKDMTESNTSAAYLGMLLSIRREWLASNFPLRQT